MCIPVSNFLASFLTGNFPPMLVCKFVCICYFFTFLIDNFYDAQIKFFIVFLNNNFSAMCACASKKNTKICKKNTKKIFEGVFSSRFARAKLLLQVIFTCFCLGQSDSKIMVYNKPQSLICFAHISNFEALYGAQEARAAKIFLHIWDQFIEFSQSVYATVSHHWVLLPINKL